MNIPTQIDLRPVDSLLPNARNSRTHSDEQVAQIAASIKEFGWTCPVLVGAEGVIIAGHARVLAARKLGMDEVPVIALAHLTPAPRRAPVIADNKLALNAGWDEETLRAEMAWLEQDGFDLAVVGFSDEELRALLAGEEPGAAAGADEEPLPEPPAQTVTKPGDVWVIGGHRLICGDCRDASVVARLFDGRQANVVVTSPPYATQREYDPASGFRPVAPEDYVDWYRDVAASIASVLASDGSYFLNIKEHAEDGQRHLYVKDLFIAHARQWGWRFVDEFCWRKTNNGVPGGWRNRFENAWEPITHFSRAEEAIKSHPFAVGHRFEGCFDYSPDNPKSSSGSGLLGTGARGEAAGKAGSRDEDGRFAGIARPSNVIEAKPDSSQGSPSAPFPRAAPESFIKAFSDADDVIVDPLLGRGQTEIAAGPGVCWVWHFLLGCDMLPVMKRIVLLLVPAALMLAWFGRTQTATVSPGAAPAEGPVSFRLTFGERQDREADQSGSIALSQGTVVRIAPWRFFGQDAVEGANGWKLRIKRGPLENQPDQPRPIASPGPNQNIVPAGVTVTAAAPPDAEARVRTAQGEFSFRLSDLADGRVLRFQDDDVMAQRVPTPERIAEPGPEHDYPSLAIARDGTVWVAWQAYQDMGEHVMVRHSAGAVWSEPATLTEKRGDIFRTAVEQDAAGRIWVVWSERTGQDWDLYARALDGRAWSARRKLTAGGTNIFHRLVRDRAGALHLVWVGHRDGQSRVMWSRLDGTPVEVSGPSAWMPEAAADSKGNLWVAWDSYQNGNYDIFLRRVSADGTLGAIQQVTRSPRFQAHASVAVDARDRVWVAWDESGANWGKDWARDDTWRGTTLYTDRRTRVAVFENGVWKQPAADPMMALPPRYNRYVEAPHLASDGQGRIWLALRVRTSTAQNRTDFWANNGRWELFLTSLEGNRWTPAAPLPGSSTRPDGVFQLAAASRGVWAAWMNDNRFFGGPGVAPNRRVQQEIDAAPLAYSAPREAQLEAFAEAPGNAAAMHRDERADVARLRGYRAGAYGIVRADFHRHTEVSGDGAGDGSIEDYFRYMIDAAAMDTGIIADHSAGNSEYTWWRTEKANDLFRIRGGFTPLFGYERSVPYPNGHRNLVFAQRGVPVLAISREEMQGKANTGPVLYPYLKQNRGICMLHSLATDQGSDYRDNDPEVEPLVEIYQGYHANYEYAGAPRAEVPGYTVATHGQFRPLGFYWNALEKGYKLGVESSSDHISTHTSYTMVFSPSTERADVVEAMRKRHAYGATDNIVLEFRAGDAIMGDAIAATAPPRMAVKAIGTGAIDRIDIVKDGKFVFENRPGREAAEFTWVDNAPGNGRSWYYVRVIQADRQMAWSSPIWVDYSRR